MLLSEICNIPDCLRCVLFDSSFFSLIMRACYVCFISEHVSIITNMAVAVVSVIIIIVVLPVLAVRGRRHRRPSTRGDCKKSNLLSCCIVTCIACCCSLTQQSIKPESEFNWAYKPAAWFIYRPSDALCRHLKCGINLNIIIPLFYKKNEICICSI